MTGLELRLKTNHCDGQQRQGAEGVEGGGCGEWGLAWVEGGAERLRFKGKGPQGACVCVCSRIEFICSFTQSSVCKFFCDFFNLHLYLTSFVLFFTVGHMLPCIKQHDVKLVHISNMRMLRYAYAVCPYT